MGVSAERDGSWLAGERARGRLCRRRKTKTESDETSGREARGGCRVKVERGWKKGQWRVSCVSLENLRPPSVKVAAAFSLPLPPPCSSVSFNGGSDQLAAATPARHQCALHRPRGTSFSGSSDPGML